MNWFNKPSKPTKPKTEKQKFKEPEQAAKDAAAAGVNLREDYLNSVLTKPEGFDPENNLDHQQDLDLLNSTPSLIDKQEELESVERQLTDVERPIFLWLKVIICVLVEAVSLTFLIAELGIPNPTRWAMGAIATVALLYLAYRAAAGTIWVRIVSTTLYVLLALAILFIRVYILEIDGPLVLQLASSLLLLFGTVGATMIAESAMRELRRATRLRNDRNRLNRAITEQQTQITDVKAAQRVRGQQVLRYEQQRRQLGARYDAAFALAMRQKQSRPTAASPPIPRTEPVEESALVPSEWG